MGKNLNILTRRVVTLLFVCIIVVYQLQAQSVCGSQDNLDQAGYNAIIKRNRALIKTEPINQKSTNQIIIIPIVIHIYHHDNWENSEVKVEQVYSQVRALNEDFSGSGIQFKIATSDHPTGPEGMRLECGQEAIIWHDLNTNISKTMYEGQTRTRSNSNTLNDGVYKYKLFETHPQQGVQWSASDYLNIYIFPTISSSFIPGNVDIPEFFTGIIGVSNVLGYNINIPPYQTSGPVVDFRAFGTTKYGTLSPNTELYDTRVDGHNLSHEIGHWLGLLHTWGLNEGSCLNNDGISDTPSQEYPSVALSNGFCPSKIECGHSVLGENIMDYSSDQCIKGFSVQQKTLMYQNLTTNSLRNSLVSKADSKIWGCSPVNDEYFCAAQLSSESRVNYSDVFSLDGSTDSGFKSSNPSCSQSNSTKDIWFAFTPQTSTEKIIAVYGSGNVRNDLIMEIYVRSSNGELELLDCDDDTNNLMPSVTLKTNHTFQTHYVRILDFYNNYSGEIIMSIVNKCDEVLLLSENNKTLSQEGRYKAGNLIRSNQKISEFNNNYYYWGPNVVLDSGFEINLGNTLTIENNGCILEDAGG